MHSVLLIGTAPEMQGDEGKQDHSVSVETRLSRLHCNAYLSASGMGACLPATP